MRARTTASHPEQRHIRRDERLARMCNWLHPSPEGRVARVARRVGISTWDVVRPARLRRLKAGVGTLPLRGRDWSLLARQSETPDVTVGLVRRVLSDIPCYCLFARNFSLIRQNKFPVRACAGNGTLVLESSYQSSAKRAESGEESRSFPAILPVGRESLPHRLAGRQWCGGQSRSRVPDAVQREAPFARNGAPLVRDRTGLRSFGRSRFCSAPLRFASCCAAPGTHAGSPLLVCVDDRLGDAEAVDAHRDAAIDRDLGEHRAYL